jgi:casein kinase II subunit beta
MIRKQSWICPLSFKPLSPIKNSYRSSGMTSEKKQSKHSVITDSDSSGDGHKLPKSWLDIFMEQPGSDWFCRVPPSFAGDGFNTFGLRVDSTHAKSAFAQLIGTAVPKAASSDSYDSDSEDEIDKCTEHIFGLIHSRYIFTPEGLVDMYQKYQKGVFGNCPRFGCNDERLLPVGLYDAPSKDTVKLYCRNCRQLYEPDEAHAHLDGAYFTKSFAHYFLLELRQSRRMGPSEQTTDMFATITSEPPQNSRSFKS